MLGTAPPHKRTQQTATPGVAAACPKPWPRHVQHMPSHCIKQSLRQTGGQQYHSVWDSMANLGMSCQAFHACLSCLYLCLPPHTCLCARTPHTHTHAHARAHARSSLAQQHVVTRPANTRGTAPDAALARNGTIRRRLNMASAACLGRLAFLAWRSAAAANACSASCRTCHGGRL